MILGRDPAHRINGNGHMAVSGNPVNQNMVARGHQDKQLVARTGRQAQPKGSADEPAAI